MRCQAAVTLLVVALVAVMSSTVRSQSANVPAALQKLREPLTGISLKDIFANMQNTNTVDFYTNCVVNEKATCDSVGRALRHLLFDHRGGDICPGCTKCERERVQYVIDTMEEKYPRHACAVRNKVGTHVFSGRVCQ